MGIYKAFIVTFCWISVLCASAPNASAKIIGSDNRTGELGHACNDIGYTVARLIIPTDRSNPDLATVTAIKLPQTGPFFITVAHAFYKKGKLKAPVDEIYAKVLTRNAHGECVYKTARVKRFAVGSVKPRQTFFGAARDLMVFELVGDDLSDDDITAIEYRNCSDCTDKLAKMTAFSWDINHGLLPYTTQCNLRKSPEESEYDDLSFTHHDCDTSAGASGALMLLKDASGAEYPHSIHAVGWGRNGREFGHGAYNVSIPLDTETLNLLYRAMIKFGD